MKQTTHTMAEATESPLDAIRRAEAEVSRRVAAAREDAEQSEAHARSQISAIKEEIESEGHREGEALYDRLIADARAEAEIMVAEARDQAEILRFRGQARMDDAVRRAVEFVIGIGGEGSP